MLPQAKGIRAIRQFCHSSRYVHRSMRMAQTIGAETREIPPAARAAVRLSWAWLGVVPFFAFVAAFLFYPALSIVIQTFFDSARNPTLQNMRDLNQPFITSSYLYTIQLERCDRADRRAAGLPAGLRHHARPASSVVRSSLLTFSGVASNFAGVPLAFAFIATLGRARADHAVAQIDRHFDLPAALTCTASGAWRHLYLLPVPADGADYGARARRAQA